MKQMILQKLKNIEQRYNVRVLLAVESGSRAWGFASPNSDYDVRFVYVHPRDWYLSFQKSRDVIEGPISDDLDLSGWDLRKALTLLGSGNCTIAEWLNAPIVYYKDDGFYRDICEIKEQYFRPVSTVIHYYHLAMNHDKRYLEKRGNELKRYMYHIRGLLAAKWALEKRTFAPVPFKELVDAEVEELSIKKALYNLVKLKSSSKEHDKCIVDEALMDYATRLARNIAALLPTLRTEVHPDLRPIDLLFLKIIDRKEAL